MIKYILTSLSVLAVACNAVPNDTTAELKAATPEKIIVSPTNAAQNTLAVKTVLASHDETNASEHNESLRNIAEPIRSNFWIAKDAQQGAVINARAPSNSHSVTLNGLNLPLSEEGFFLMGFDRDAGPNATLIATLGDGSKIEKRLNIGQGKWRLEHINAPYRAGRSSKSFRALRGPEIAQIVAARRIETNSQGWRQDFIWPVKGRISGRFGSQRVYQGKPGSYHSGLDIAVPTGTPYVAPADGVVTLVSQKPFTLEGNLLMIDHGNGLNSAFLHSSSIAVKKGDIVKQGQVIGRVGATGRATGPHLHWGMKWNKARTDPLLLLPPQ